MSTSTTSKRLVVLLAAVAVAAGLFISASARAADDGKAVLFNGKDLTGWKLRTNNAETKGTWKVVSEVKVDPKDPANLVGTGDGGTADAAMLRGKIDHGSDIMTEQKFGDCELHCEFMVAKGTNSGVYLQGEYEIQIADSVGRPDNRMGPGDGGAIYGLKAPTVNANKAPGEWQTLDVEFRAPRFDASGKKTEDAKFVKVVMNGKTIHENLDVPKPTGGEISREVPTGPLMFQGDHGIVAYRNVWIKPVASK